MWPHSIRQDLSTFEMNLAHETKTVRNKDTEGDREVVTSVTSLVYEGNGHRDVEQDMET